VKAENFSRIFVSKSGVVISAVIILVFFAAANKFWSYGPLEKIDRLTAGHLADKGSKGQAFRFKGAIAYLFRTQNDLFIVTLKSQNGGVSIQVPIWPSSGKLPRLRRGDTVEIVGNLGRYRGKPQLNPLSSEHIRIIDETDYSRALPLAEAITRLKETLLIGPVKGVKTLPFVSKKSGREHLRLIVRDGDVEAEGIIFSGSWDDLDVEVLESGRLVYLRAKVAAYRGKPNLQTLAVKVR